MIIANNYKNMYMDKIYLNVTAEVPQCTKWEKKTKFIYIYTTKESEIARNLLVYFRETLRTAIVYFLSMKKSAKLFNFHH